MRYSDHASPSRSALLARADEVIEMKRREFIARLAAAVAWPSAARPQQRKLWRVGWLDAGSAPRADNLESFRQGLKDLGYTEGRDLVIEQHFAEGNIDRLPILAGDLVRVNVDVILAVASFAVQAAKEATTEIPIVMTGVGDPVRSGFVASITRPGGNITGLGNVSIEISSKYLEFLHAILPTLARVGVMIDPVHPNHPTILNRVQVGGEASGIGVSSIEVQGDEIERALERVTLQGFGGLIVPPHPTWAEKARRISDLALKNRLPTMFGFAGAVEVGGLMSYAPSYPDMYRRAATLVDKILKGAKPADLPVEFPTRFELALNLRTANVLDLQIPVDLRVRADKVIE